MLNDFKDEDFDSKIKNEDISVIQFSAAWCGPCKTLIPVMTKLSDDYKDKAGFYYADIEDGGINTGSAAGIRGVPTVIIYKKGVEVDRKVGGVPESHMKEFLDKNGEKKRNFVVAGGVAANWVTTRARARRMALAHGRRARAELVHHRHVARVRRQSGDIYTAVLCSKAL